MVELLFLIIRIRKIHQRTTPRFDVGISKDIYLDIEKEVAYGLSLDWHAR